MQADAGVSVDVVVVIEERRAERAGIGHRAEPARERRAVPEGLLTRSGRVGDRAGRSGGSVRAPCRLVEASAACLPSAAAVHGTRIGEFTPVMMDKETELSLSGDWAGLVARWPDP